jgi:membrane protease YdiL (CAAX protease family)
VAETGSAGPPTTVDEGSGDVQERRPWSPLVQVDAFLGLVLVFGGVIVAGGLVLGLISEEPDRTLAALVPQGLIFLGVPLFIASMRTQSRPWRALGFVPFRAKDLGLVAAAMGIQVGITVLFTLLFFTPEQDTILDDVNFSETTVAALAAVFLIVIAAPVTEETLFRGLFFGALRTRAPFWLAAGASGLLFGAVHLASGDVAVAGLLTLFGVILAWLYERTGSLGPPIILHMVNNGIAIIPLLS